MNNARRALVGWLVVAGLGCGSSGAPFERTEKTVVTGVARQVLEAGPYMYVELEKSDKTAIWVASLARDLPPGTPVEAVVLGRREGFHSARLNRDFDTLGFGPVRPIPQGAVQ